MTIDIMLIYHSIRDINGLHSYLYGYKPCMIIYRSSRSDDGSKDMCCMASTSCGDFP